MHSNNVRNHNWSRVSQKMKQSKVQFLKIWFFSRLIKSSCFNEVAHRKSQTRYWKEFCSEKSASFIHFSFKSFWLSRSTNFHMVFKKGKTCIWERVTKRMSSCPTKNIKGNDFLPIKHDDVNASVNSKTNLLWFREERACFLANNFYKALIIACLWLVHRLKNRFKYAIYGQHFGRMCSVQTYPARSLSGNKLPIAS